jgi:hypothetical protein
MNPLLFLEADFVLILAFIALSEAKLWSVTITNCFNAFLTTSGRAVRCNLYVLRKKT